jgi:hypothetical protein
MKFSDIRVEIRIIRKANYSIILDILFDQHASMAHASEHPFPTLTNRIYYYIHDVYDVCASGTFGDSGIIGP